MTTLSPKLVFYLQHRRQIDEWAALRDRVQTELCEWLYGWADAMEENPPESDAALFRSEEETRWVRLLWYRSRWGAPEDWYPRVGVGFGWQYRPQKTQFPEVRVGVRVDMDGYWPDNDRIRDELSRRVSELNLNKPDSNKTSWPFRRRLESIDSRFHPGSDKQYESEVVRSILRSYREDAITEAHRVWEALADEIDEAVDQVLEDQG